MCRRQKKHNSDETVKIYLNIIQMGQCESKIYLKKTSFNWVYEREHLFKIIHMGP